MESLRSLEIKLEELRKVEVEIVEVEKEVKENDTTVNRKKEIEVKIKGWNLRKDIEEIRKFGKVVSW